ncbi:MAG: VOC family protein [Rubripirellula sp.]
MSEQTHPKPAGGSISWIDLTVDDANGVREFYEEVTGWTSQAVSMEDYDDFCMVSDSGETVAGICHAQGENADLPAQWLIYINVNDLEASIAACEKLGGAVISGPRQVGGGRCAVIRDPAGAVAALYETDQEVAEPG